MPGKKVVTFSESVDLVYPYMKDSGVPEGSDEFDNWIIRRENARVRASIALSVLEELNGQVLKYEPVEPSTWTDNDVQVVILKALRQLRRLDPSHLDYLPMDPTGICLVKRIAKDQFDYNLQRLIDRGWVKVLGAGWNSYQVNATITESGTTALERSEAAAQSKASPQVLTAKPPEDSRSVFVVHGRDTKLRDALFLALRSIGLHPIEWSQAILATRKPLPYVGEVLDAAFAKAAAIVVLISPDDEARLRESLREVGDSPYEAVLTGQARANVLFEAGMAMGRSPDRTVLVEVGNLRPFSDIGGRHVVRLDNTSERRQDLAQRLKLAGCDIDLNGTDWHSAGDFVRPDE